MNAILTLCHFCELHGPKIVFNTQTFRDLPSLSDIGMTTSTKEDADENQHLWKYGRIESSETFKSYPSYITDSCSACRSFSHTKAGIITNDDENLVSFVSSQYPFQEEIFTLLRQAGIRSLSCEIYSEREGPIYFGDNARGHVISYTFFLRDIQARGFLRRYSILVMMADKMFLLNSWSFFIKYIQDIINLLQDLACKVYTLEEKHESHQKGLKPPIATDISKRHRAIGNPRPLTQLVGDQNVWTILHTKFTWILKVGGLRLQEKLVEGPPLFVPELENRNITLRSLVSMLTPKYLEKLLHHIYIGNKIVIETLNENLLEDVLYLLKLILPEYLFRPLRLKTERDTADKCNIITAAPPLGSSVNHLWFLIKIHARNEDEELLVEHKTHNYEIEVTEPFLLESRPPQIVSKLCAQLENPRLSKSVLNLYFATLNDEWTNKVKIWSHMKQNQQKLFSSLSSTTQSSNLRPPSSPSTSTLEKKVMLNKSASSIQSTAGGGFNVLLTVVGALECDITMLNASSTAYEEFKPS